MGKCCVGYAMRAPQSLQCKRWHADGVYVNARASFSTIFLLSLCRDDWKFVNSGSPTGAINRY